MPKTNKGKTRKGKTIHRKTLSRKTLKIKGCAHDPTYLSLLTWNQSSFEQLGSMI